MKKRIIIALVILNTLGALFIIFGVNWKQVSQNGEMAAEAKKFKNNLIEALKNADRVDIVEHSWYLNLPKEVEEESLEPRYFEYKRVTLTTDQQNQFRQIFVEMSRKPRTDFLPCMFEPHHTIEIYDQEGEKTLVRICFRCGDTSWDQTETITPAPFQSVFFKFIEPLGFEADRDWYSLAKEREEALETD